jgi:UDP-N-acetylmuramoyl-tripeptide--D-alanyl-D-alanine ligase
MKLTIQEIIKATQGDLIAGDPSLSVASFSTDSRKIQRGDFFICLKGPNFDGHDFIGTVIEQEASGILIQKGRELPEAARKTLTVIVTVQDTLKALGDIALAWRRKFTIPLLAVAGSNGKTTTKDMAAAVLGAQFKTLATEGNLNNLIGVPIMLFKLKPEHEAAVIEMGMNDFGENARLTQIAEPTVGLITNVGLEHLEKLKNLEGVAKAEGELFEKLPPGSLALVNQDDPWVSKLPTRAFRITYGMDSPADVFCLRYLESDKNLKMEIRFRGKNYAFEVPAFGETGARNALAAISVGFGLGLEPKKIQKGLKEFKGRPLRMEKITLKEGVLLLNDCYNANPSSMQAALHSLGRLKKDNPGLAILGEMLEMGEFAREGHRRVGEAVAQSGIEYLIAVGPFAEDLVDAAQKKGMDPSRCRAALHQEEIFEGLLPWVQQARAVLIKGSRGSKMEKVTEFIRKQFN